MALSLVIRLYIYRKLGKGMQQGPSRSESLSHLRTAPILSAFRQGSFSGLRNRERIRSGGGASSSVRYSRLRSAGNVLLITALSADLSDKHKDYAQLLCYQAQLMAELPLDDPYAYTELVCKLIK